MNTARSVIWPDTAHYRWMVLEGGTAGKGGGQIACVLSAYRSSNAGVTLSLPFAPMLSWSRVLKFLSARLLRVRQAIC